MQKGRSIVDVVVVGLGEAGADLHLPALDSLPGVRIVALCDTDPSRRDWAAQRVGTPVFETLSSALAATSPALAIVATPPESHRVLALEALAVGANLLVEKPFAPSVADAEEVLEAAERSNLVVGVNHEFREMPILRRVLDHAESGEDGGPRFVQLWQTMNRPPGTEPGWRGELAQRTLYEAGAHLVDFAMAVYGEQPRAVSATQAGLGTPATDAVIVSTLEFSSGRLAQITQSRVSPGAAQYFEARVDLERATLRASFGGRARLSVGAVRTGRPHFRAEFGRSGVAWREVGSRRRYLARNPARPNVVATRAVIAGTVEAVASPDLHPPTTGRWGRDVIETIAACYHSADVGQRIDIRRHAEALRDMRLGHRTRATNRREPDSV